MASTLHTPQLLGLARGRREGRTAAAAVDERCELCAQTLADEHRHLFDVPAQTLLCACQACCVLFDNQAAGGRHYRLVPRRRVRIDASGVDGAVWAGLGVPVDLAFLVRDSQSDEVVARYPSAAGALRAVVPAEAWRRLVAVCPVLRDQDTDVEALVVNRARGASEWWLLPLDDCYRLTATLREYWTGFGGGDEVWRRIAWFFDELREVR